MVDQARLDRMYREVLGRPRPRSLRQQTLDRLKADVLGSPAERLWAELGGDDPQAIRRAQVRLLRHEVENPAVFARATRVREFRERDAASTAQLVLQPHRD